MDGHCVLKALAGGLREQPQPEPSLLPQRRRRAGKTACPALRGKETEMLTEVEKKLLGMCAQLAIKTQLAGETGKQAPALPPKLVKSTLAKSLGSFVTLKIRGRLRGCIGTMIGHEPLFRNVWRMARAAAFEDLRFPPLRPEEFERLDIHISVVGPLSPCPSIDQIEIGRHGLLLELDGSSGVFLPEVPVEQGWNKQMYLENLCIKAGLPSKSWRHERAHLYWYETFSFDVPREDAPKPAPEPTQAPNGEPAPAGGRP